MNPSEEIDNLIAQHQEWRGATLAKLRRTILEVDPEIAAFLAEQEAHYR